MAYDMELGVALQENILVMLVWGQKAAPLIANYVDLNLFTVGPYKEVADIGYKFCRKNGKPVGYHLAGNL